MMLRQNQRRARRVLTVALRPPYSLPIQAASKALLGSMKTEVAGRTGKIGH
jgi:hypothetical protein